MSTQQNSNILTEQQKASALQKHRNALAAAGLTPQQIDAAAAQKAAVAAAVAQRNASSSNGAVAGVVPRPGGIAPSSSAPAPAAPVRTPTQPSEQSLIDAKRRKERFLMFTRVLMRYLEQKDPPMNQKAKMVIKDCAEKNKKGHRDYVSLTLAMQQRLRQTVGEVYWKKAEEYLNHLLRAQHKKQQLAAAQKKTAAAAASGQQQKPATAVTQPAATTQASYQPNQQPQRPQYQQPQRPQYQQPTPYQPQPAVRAQVQQQTPSQHMQKKQTAAEYAAQINQRYRQDAKKKSDEATAAAAAAAAKKVKPKPVQKRVPMVLPPHMTHTATMQQGVGRPMTSQQVPIPGMSGLPPSSQQTMLDPNKAPGVVAAQMSSVAMQPGMQQQPKQNKKKQKKSKTAVPPIIIPTHPNSAIPMNNTIGVDGTMMQKPPGVGATMGEQPQQPLPQPKPKKYDEQMEMVEHNVDYDWTTANYLLNQEFQMDVNLDEEQRVLLYGQKNNKKSIVTSGGAANVGASAPAPGTAVTDQQSKVISSMRGWNKKNIISSRIAWARVRLREEQDTPSSSTTQSSSTTLPLMPTPLELSSVSVQDVKPPTNSLQIRTKASQPSPNKWHNEENAEKDPTLCLLSQATETYLKNMLQSAISVGRKRQNLDGIRLWHLQHGSTKPSLSLRLGCDVRRQTALSVGNATKVYQRMEEAYGRHYASRKRKTVDIDIEDTVCHDATSMGDLSKKLFTDSSTALETAKEADIDARKNFQVYGGKDAGAPPFGRVPKKCKLTPQDFGSFMPTDPKYQVYTTIGGRVNTVL